MFALAWQYMTGRAVASDVSDRTAPEWPPHPDRVFQALVDAWGARGEDATERAALEWLEAQAPAHLAVPDDDHTWSGAAPTVYVPANDVMGSRSKKYSDGKIALLPTARKRNERTFPATVVGNSTCALIWPEVEAGEHAAALVRLAGETTRIGHSSSLVRCWVDNEPPAPSWEPTDQRDPAELFLRVPRPGRLASLTDNFAGGGPAWRRPAAGAWHRYRPAASQRVPRGNNAGQMILLRRSGGVQPGLQRVLQLGRALRRRMGDAAKANPAIRSLITGHHPDGRRFDPPHVSFIPLPFVDAAHADGHLLGLGLVLPTEIEFVDADEIIEALYRCLDPETNAIELDVGGGRTVSLTPEERPAPPRALRRTTWAGASFDWATVTPIVLDRMPPRRHKDPDAFVKDQLKAACQRIGLPEPREVLFGDVAFMRGVPSTRSFAGLEMKNGRGRRHVHAIVRFDERVRGPLLLGAGRYLGMGLMRPVRNLATEGTP